jgi:hypothetical protein
MKTQRYRIFWGLIVVFSLLAGCSRSTPLPTPTATLIPTPLSTPSPTPISLSDIDLEPMIILSGDLPAGYSGAQIRDTPPVMFAEIRGYENTIYQQFERNGKGAGGVTIFLFDLIDQRETAYSLIVDGFGKTENTSATKTRVAELSGVGEKAMYVTIEASVAGITVDNIDLVFARCHSVVHVRMTDTASVDYISAYAKRLDKRLAEVICQ